ncbi:MAG: hypothetical protein V1917_00790 [Candidatus Gottesmanbacteria bacterium]
MILSSTQIRFFQKMIFVWWKIYRRDLPWRHIHDPYKILVSEVMLQQTQVSRVLARYADFIEVFPTVQSLAKATPAAVLRVWKGMGYNRRAVYLHATAKKIVSEYGGVFPTDEQQLLALPGIGSYTARAVLVFAFKRDIAMVDTNIRQIITHFFFDDVYQPEKIIQSVADKLVPQGTSWEWHQALMDYGALKLERNKKQRVKKKIKPFKETNRYFRGRIIDQLREKSFKEKELIKILCLAYGKDITFYMGLLERLEAEGLITHKKDIWRLPA